MKDGMIGSQASHEYNGYTLRLMIDEKMKYLENQNFLNRETCLII